MDRININVVKRLSLLQESLIFSVFLKVCPEPVTLKNFRQVTWDYHTTKDLEKWIIQ